MGDLTGLESVGSGMLSCSRCAKHGRRTTVNTRSRHTAVDAVRAVLVATISTWRTQRARSSPHARPSAAQHVRVFTLDWGNNRHWLAGVGLIMSNLSIHSNAVPKDVRQQNMRVSSSEMLVNNMIGVRFRTEMRDIVVTLFEVS